MLWIRQGIAYMPTLLVFWSSASFIIPYITAVVLKHVKPLVPYISDTGTKPPESGIFGFMFSISSFLGAATIYARYKILVKQNELSAFLPNYLNITSLVVGLIGCTGMCIVATFQEMSVPVIHDVGALITFVCGVFYILLQSFVSYKSCPLWTSKILFRLRMVISLVSLVAVIPMVICASFINFLNFAWDPNEKEYKFHMASAICEWIVAFGFVFYFLTYIQEFRIFALAGCCFLVILHLLKNYYLGFHTCILFGSSTQARSNHNVRNQSTSKICTVHPGENQELPYSYQQNSMKTTANERCI